MPGLDPRSRRCPLPDPAGCAVQSRGTGAAQRGAPLRHQWRHLRPLSRSATGSILAPISRDGRRSGGGAVRQKAPPRGQARHRAGPARAGYRLGLGRAWALSGQGGGLRRDGRDAQSTSSSRSPTSARRERASAAPVRFEFKDYRKVVGHFDRIVSVGMFEHVGVNHYGTYFQKVRELLDRGRRRPDPHHRPLRAARPSPIPSSPSTSSPAATSPPSRRWWRRSSAPAWSSPTSRCLRLHYAETLRAWRQRFLANWDKAAAILDEKLLPDVGILSGRLRGGLPLPGSGGVPAAACQAHPALPLTRDYMCDDEQRLLARDAIDRRPRMAGE